jgi:hypothetical protein
MKNRGTHLEDPVSVALRCGNIVTLVSLETVRISDDPVVQQPPGSIGVAIQLKDSGEAVAESMINSETIS